MQMHAAHHGQDGLILCQFTDIVESIDYARMCTTQQDNGSVTSFEKDGLVILKVVRLSTRRIDAESFINLFFGVVARDLTCQEDTSGYFARCCHIVKLCPTVNRFDTSRGYSDIPHSGR